MNSACLGTRAWIEYDVLVCSLGRLSDSSMSELWPFPEIFLPTLLKELWVMITADRKVGSGEGQTRNKTNSGGWEGTALCALQSEWLGEWFSYRWVRHSFILLLGSWQAHTMDTVLPRIHSSNSAQERRRGRGMEGGLRRRRSRRGQWEGRRQEKEKRSKRVGRERGGKREEKGERVDMDIDLMQSFLNPSDDWGGLTLDVVCTEQQGLFPHLLWNENILLHVPQFTVTPCTQHWHCWEKT